MLLSHKLESTRHPWFCLAKLSIQYFSDPQRHSHPCITSHTSQAEIQEIHKALRIEAARDEDEDEEGGEEGQKGAAAEGTGSEARQAGAVAEAGQGQQGQAGAGEAADGDAMDVDMEDVEEGEGWSCLPCLDYIV